MTQKGTVQPDKTFVFDCLTLRFSLSFTLFHSLSLSFTLFHSLSLSFTLFHTISLVAAEQKVISAPYDYIIAGGGLSGCLLAERLSADGSKRVLVLEAGRPDYDHTFIRIPAGVLRLFRSVYDWQFETSGEQNCHGRNVYLQRGKVSAFMLIPKETLS